MILLLVRRSSNRLVRLEEIHIDRNIGTVFNKTLFFFSDWSEETVSSAEILRLIYQGRFLHGNVTLSALGLATGKTTVMHLVPRESLPEPNSQGEEREFISSLNYVIMYIRLFHAKSFCYKGIYVQSG